MVKTKKTKIDMRLIGLGMALILLLAGAGFLYLKYASVAMVNGRPISRLEYIKKMEAQVGATTLDQMIDEALIAGEAEKTGVKVEQSVIDEEIDKIRQQIEAQGQTLEAALEAEGMVMADLEEQIRNQKLVEEMAGAGEEVTEVQIADFLETYKDQLPEGQTKEELETLAKEQLSGQAKNEAVTEWLDNLRAGAEIVYK